MKRLFVILSLLLAMACAGGVTALHQMVVARKNAAGVTYFLEEGFENPGYENSWTETDTSNLINDQYTADVLNGSYSWFLDNDNATAAYAVWDFGSAGPTQFWFECNVKALHSDASWRVKMDDNSSTGWDCIQARFDDLLWRIWCGGNYGGASASHATGTTYRLEISYPEGKLLVNGSELLDAANDTSPNNLRYVMIGLDAVDLDGDTIIDNVKISTNGWVTGP